MYQKIALRKDINESRRAYMSWIGVDLDKTLALYDSGDYHRFGATYIGEPIMPMVEFVRSLLSQGFEVKIFTARVDGEYNSQVKEAIQNWTEKHLGARLDVTNVKTMDMECLYDDRARQVLPNKGIIV